MPTLKDVLAASDPTPDLVEPQPTLAELVFYLAAQGVPPSARIIYGNCGSHDFNVTWEGDNDATTEAARAGK